LLNGGGNGFSFCYPNSQDLAAKINILLDDDKLRQKMSRNAQQWVVHYHSKEHTINQYRTIYRRLIDDVVNQKP
jgi:glycosyltransferase, family 1